LDVLQIGDLGTCEPIPLQTARHGLIAPDEVEVIWFAIRHAFDQDFVDCRVHHRDGAKSDCERPERRYNEYWRPQQSTTHQLEIATPIASVPPGSSGAHALAKTVPDRMRQGV
jgi:hypothetical protein